MGLLQKLRSDFKNPGRYIPAVLPEELSVMLDTLMKMDAYTFGAYAFSRDIMRGRCDIGKRQEYTRQAILCGQEYAQQMRSMYGEKTCLQISRELGLTVLFLEKPLGGGKVLFAQYKEPDEITVFTDCTEKARQAFESQELPDSFRKMDVQEILIAHELFHYLEFRDRETIFTRKELIVLPGIGARKRTAKLTAPSEIASMSFAQQITGLDFSPYILDVFFSYLYNQEAAYSLYREIVKLSASWMETVQEGE